VDQDRASRVSERRRHTRAPRPRRTESTDPAWYKQAIIYELHVRTFHDSDGDGIGDFTGLTVSVAFLQSYFSTADRDLLPRSREDLHLLPDTQLFERTLYELGHELTHRPDWISVPLRDLSDLLEEDVTRGR